MKVLVVGCGSIGRRHAANAARLAVTAVCDLDHDLVSRCAAEMGVRGFPHLEAALAWGPQAVVVATPHRTHLAIATAAVAAGARVLVEKPLSHSLEGVDAFLAAVAAQGRRAFTVCNMRFHPGPETLRKHLQDIGAVRYAVAHYGNYLPSMRPGSDYRQLYAARKQEGGGVILDAIHELDYLSWLFGPIDRVGCRAATLGELDIETEDYAELSLLHAGGVRSLVQLDYLRRQKSRGCEVVGEKGTLIWHSDGKNPERCQVRLFDAEENAWRNLFSIPAVDINLPYFRLMEEFLSEVAGEGSGLLLDAGTAAHELRVALAAHESAVAAGRELALNQEIENAA
jgi:predicted dehydrogenase